MTNQTLFELMSEIDFDLIERAEAPVPLRKKPVFRVAMIAAALALVLTLSTVSAGVAGTVAVTVRYVDYVEQNYPEYDGTLLHFAQIFLTEDENLISSLLTEDAKHAIGGAIAALRENWGGIGGKQSKESTEEPEEQTSGQESETERGEDSTETIEPSRVFVHSSFDSLSLIAGDEETVLFTLDTYSQWLHQVTLDDPNVTHIKLRGWLAFADPEPGIYGYSIDGGEKIYDLAFSQEAEEMVHVVSSYHGGKSCSRMEILVPVSDLAPGEHDIALRAKASGGAERTFLTFTVIVPDGGEETETEPEITDEEPEQGWSEGLEYTKETQDGKTVYVVSGIGECKDTDVYIPPTYRGYPVVAIGKEAFFNVLIDFVSVPSTVKEIGEYAFFNCSVKRVELSEGVEVIGDSAFSDAYYLEEINFPSTLKTIGSYAFCATDLTQVILPDSVTEVHGHAFTSCLHVTEIRLSANLTEIKAYMFEGVRNVKNIELPRGIERIGEWAFMQCSRLETVTLYHGVLQIDDNIFEYCEDIKEIRFIGTQAEWESIDMSKKTREQLTPLVVYVEE
ncbi:MAG: leucine-rich repeat protein [Clostridia bacterium]|nr:leucine-rich repeat protein [Clostridia bacterium]